LEDVSLDKPEPIIRKYLSCDGKYKKWWITTSIDEAEKIKNALKNKKIEVKIINNAFKLYDGTIVPAIEFYIFDYDIFHKTMKSNLKK